MKRIAILGASSDRAKFGNKAVRAYARRGWEVIPVHPQEEEIEGIAVVRDLGTITGPLDRISVYVPPRVGLELLPAIKAAGAREVWFNPGAESAELMKRAKEIAVPAIYGCSIVDIGELP
jgi:predicted CoA-binding protein